jgi:hypothetical protein
MKTHHLIFLAVGCCLFAGCDRGTTSSTSAETEEQQGVDDKSSDFEADIAVVANAADKDERQHVTDFLRSPTSTSGATPSIAMNAINIASSNKKIALPLARCCKRLALDMELKRNTRSYFFNRLTDLAPRDKTIAVIAADVAKEIAGRENDPLKQKADAFLSKTKR